MSDTRGWRLGPRPGTRSTAGDDLDTPQPGIVAGRVRRHLDLRRPHLTATTVLTAAVVRVTGGVASGALRDPDARPPVAPEPDGSSTPTRAPSWIDTTTVSPNKGASTGTCHGRPGLRPSPTMFSLPQRTHASYGLFSWVNFRVHLCRPTKQRHRPATTCPLHTEDTEASRVKMPTLLAPVRPVKTRATSLCLAGLLRTFLDELVPGQDHPYLEIGFPLAPMRISSSRESGPIRHARGPSQSTCSGDTRVVPRRCA